MTEFEAATFRNATLALHKASLAQGETSNLIGCIQCGPIAAGLSLMFYFNRTRDRAQAQRRHEAAQLEAQRYRAEAERTARRDEAGRRHERRR